MAETISKINKAEDFTKQQDYIKQCSEILKIDENGLHALVNKFIRERIVTQERKFSSTEDNNFVPEPARTDWSDETFNVLFMQELQERAIARIILEYGLKPWSDGTTVFDYMSNAKLFEDKDIPDDKNISLILEEEYMIISEYPLIINEYAFMYKRGLNPTVKEFAYHENNELAILAIETTNHPYELSQDGVKMRWQQS
ncbi:MAG: hypothetical protein WDO71_05470 [Bacteroidota bacterium]